MNVTREDRRRLAAVVSNRSAPQKHVWRAHITDTTGLLVALNVLDGTVICRNMQRHRHQEFIRFLNAIEAQVPAGKLITAGSTRFSSILQITRDFRLRIAAACLRSAETLAANTRGSI